MLTVTWGLVAGLVAFTATVVAYAKVRGAVQDAKKRVEAIEVTYMQAALSASRAALAERKAVEMYLRDQARMAESVSRCALLGARGRDQEAYASAVLEETADEIAERRHLEVRP